MARTLAASPIDAGGRAAAPNPAPNSYGRRWLMPLLAVLAVGLDLGWLATDTGGTYATSVFSDLATVLLPLVAAIACVRAGLVRTGSGRRGWLLVGTGAAVWGIGNAVSAWYELVRGTGLPHPSVADAGYLAMVPLVLAGIGALTTIRRGALRGMLDGLIVAGSLLLVSWALVLGPLFAAHPDTGLARTVSLAYPIGDVALGTMLFLLLSRAHRSQRLPLGLVAAGTLSLAVAGSGSAYLAQHTSSGGDLVAAGRFTGFLLIALAGWYASRRPLTGATAAGGDRLWTAMPYAPLAAAVTVSIVLTVAGRPTSVLLYALQTALVLLVVLRQLVSVRENAVLAGRLAATVADLRDQEELLRHMAFHDSLTGVANRSLFANRAEHAMARQDREQGPMAMLYIDLDGFKPINDRLGRDTGDLLLIEVARRLRQCVRAGDTLARLGGDEFAILADAVDADGASALADRVIASLAEPFVVNDLVLGVSASIGIAGREPGEAGFSELLRRADVAMYTAKLQGKGHYVKFVAGYPGGLTDTRTGRTAGYGQPRSQAGRRSRSRSHPANGPAPVRASLPVGPDSGSGGAKVYHLPPR